MLGTDPSVLPTYQQLQGLTYVTQILNETLRLYPTAPAFTRQPYKDDVVGGYLLPKGSSITALTIMLHRDKSIWGEDADEFNPDHFRPETRATLPLNAFKPFGSGQRACIGRQFAMQEAVLVLSMVLQRFELDDYQHYELKIKESLTIKPEGLSIKLRQRLGRSTGTVPVAAINGTPERVAAQPKPRAPGQGDGHGTPLLVLFGSNLGTAEGVANKIGQDGSDRGYAVTLGTLDAHTGELPHDGALVVVCASYNGRPPDNAERFCSWITDRETGSGAAAGLAYSVFGCGNMDWASTYQAVPTLLDEQLAAHGAARVRDRGRGGCPLRLRRPVLHLVRRSLVCVSTNSSVSAPRPARRPAPSRGLQLTMTNRQTTNPAVVSYRAQPSTLLVNRELLHGGQDPETGGQSARHLELQLADGDDYAVGDHLGVLPRNNVDLIRRVMARFGLDAGTYLTIIPTGGFFTHLPVDEPTPLLGVLGSCVELQDMATRTDLSVLARYADDPTGTGRAPRDVRRSTRRAGIGYRNRIAAPRAVRARSSRRLPECRGAVQRLPRAAASDAPALLLHLLLARRVPDLSPHGRRRSGPCAQREGHVLRRGLRSPGRQHGGEHGLHVRPQADDPVPPAREPPRADDHGGRGHRPGAVPRLPPGAR